LRVKAVLFDLDGTLLDRRRSFRQFARDQLARFAAVLRGVDSEQYVEALIELDNDGLRLTRNFFAGITTRFGLPSDLAETLQHDYRARFPSACRLFADAADTLAILRASGFALGLITNGSARMQGSKVESLGLATMFDVVLLSAVEGIDKPDPKLFHLALERLGADPHESVYIGDRPDIDVAGGRAAGMYTIWRRDPMISYPVEADAIVDEIGDVLSILT